MTVSKKLTSKSGITIPDYAYFVSEAAVWQNFMQLLAACGDTTSKDVVLQQIGATFVVEDTPKIALEAN